MRKLTGLAKYSWVVLAYNLFVVVFGAFVRATGSGAGCGSHWPLCNGSVIPRAAAVETVIEYTHRITSGVTIILIAVLIVLVWRNFPRGSWLRKSSALIGLFITGEALLGAGLVLFDLVAHNASLARAISMMAHLVNTFLLLASLLVTACWLSVGVPKSIHVNNKTRILSGIGVFLFFVLGASGAVTALGDTLFPAGSLAEGLRQDIDPGAHFLIRLRVFHPMIAAGVGLYLAGFSLWLRRKTNQAALRTCVVLLICLIALQLFLGAANIFLLAPVWMQLVHLTVTTLIWLAFGMILIFSLVPPDFVAGVGKN
jgi:heme A synthase